MSEYYFASRQAAQQEIEDSGILEDPRVLLTKVELEPDNGWVIVVIPKPQDLSDLYERFEVRSEGGKRLSPRPQQYNRWTPKQAPPRPGKVPILQADPGKMLVRPAWLK